MAARILFRTFFALGGLAFLASCAEYPTTPSATVPTPTPSGYWNGDGVPGSPKIVVSIAEQHAYFFKGKNLVGESSVSTGKPGFGTPPGQYTVLSKDATHVSTVFGDYVDDAGNVVKSNIDSRKDPRPKGSHYDGARMPFAMFFRGGYAMHQGYVPPYAASHGCIRVPKEMAETFFNAATVGTPVIVKAEAFMHTVTTPPMVPASNAVVPPPAPYVVRSTGPAPVPPPPVRSTVPAPSPGPVVNRAPGPVRSPAPMVLRSPSPAPVRPAALRSTVPVISPTPVRSSASTTRWPASLQAPTPAALPSPAPASVRSRAAVPPRTTAPQQSPTPAPLQTPNPAALRSPAPAVVSPKPGPAVSAAPSSKSSKKHRPVYRRRHPVNQSAPSATPAPQ